MKTNLVKYTDEQAAQLAYIGAKRKQSVRWLLEIAVQELIEQNLTLAEVRAIKELLDKKEEPAGTGSKTQERAV